jgi:hypothetical protein
LLANEEVNWYAKRVVYKQDIGKFSEILKSNNISKSIDVLRNDAEFKKTVLIKLHPDKGGREEDFIFVRGLQEKINSKVDIVQLINDKLIAAQHTIYKANVGFKVLDISTDVLRVVHEPTSTNAIKGLVDATYLYVMYKGFNGYSLAISGAEVASQIYQGEYQAAMKHAATTAAYMALPSIGYVGVPLGVAYGAGMVVYTGYNGILNTYSFYQEYNGPDSELRSSIAYKDLAESLSNSPLQWIYDFEGMAKGYEVKLNELKLVGEKKVALEELKSTYGEFGEKLYVYIYEPLIEEKYDLLNKVLAGDLTEEGAQALKSKQISLSTDGLSYEHCVEIKEQGKYQHDYGRYSESTGDENHANEDEGETHYYCYNAEQQVLDHINIDQLNEVRVIEQILL